MPFVFKMNEWKTYKIQSGYSCYNVRAKSEKQAKESFKSEYNKVIDRIALESNFHDKYE